MTLNGGGTAANRSQLGPEGHFNPVRSSHRTSPRPALPEWAGMACPHRSRTRSNRQSAAAGPLRNADSHRSTDRHWSASSRSKRLSTPGKLSWRSGRSRFEHVHQWAARATGSAPNDGRHGLGMIHAMGLGDRGAAEADTIGERVPRLCSCRRLALRSGGLPRRSATRPAAGPPHAFCPIADP